VSIVDPTGERSASFARVQQLGDVEPLVFCASPPPMVSVEEPVVFGDDPVADMYLLWILREVASAAIRLEWTLDSDPPVDLRSITHLPPPSRAAGTAAEIAVTAWRTSYRYGTFYYRVGPGFVTVKDVRPGVTHQRFTLSGREAVLFLTIANSMAMSVNSTDRPIVEEMIELGLVLEYYSSTIAIPYRMRNWPVPFLAV